MMYFRDTYLVVKYLFLNFSYLATQIGYLWFINSPRVPGGHHLEILLWISKERKKSLKHTSLFDSWTKVATWSERGIQLLRSFMMPFHWWLVIKLYVHNTVSEMKPISCRVIPIKYMIDESNSLPSQSKKSYLGWPMFGWVKTFKTISKISYDRIMTWYMPINGPLLRESL